MRLTSVLASVAAGLALLLVGTAAYADPHDDKARVDREMAKTRAALEAASDRVAQAAEAYEIATQRLPEVQRKLDEARALLQGAQSSAKAARTRTQQVSTDLAAANRSLTLADKRVDGARDAIGVYAANAYRGRDLASVNAILNVGTPTEFVAGLTYLQRVAVSQQSTLDAYTVAQGEQRDRQAVVTARKLAADQAQREAEAALHNAAQAEAKAKQAEQEVASVVNQRRNALAVANQERAATEARYKELQAESERIAAEIRGMASGSSSGAVIKVGTRLPMPVHGWKSSDFGMRFDPFYQVWRLHAGVDLAAPGGAPIRAVAPGKVFRAGWNGGYGNYTCIYHGTYKGKGFATCYAHQSKILVRVGQQVSRGQVIGRVGTTGASTGNHLHFEVRLDGTPVNPLPWLPACLC